MPMSGEFSLPRFTGPRLMSWGGVNVAIQVAPLILMRGRAPTICGRFYLSSKVNLTGSCYIRAAD